MYITISGPESSPAPGGSKVNFSRHIGVLIVGFPVNSFQFKGIY